MIIPSRRWFLAAAALAALAPLALVWPAGAALLLVADLGWIGALLVDAWRSAAVPLDAFRPERETPPAFSVGRPLPVTYRWTNPLSYRARLTVREALPAPLRLSSAAERTLDLPARGTASEPLVIEPIRRGKARSGPLHLRVEGPWGLALRQGRLDLPWEATVFPSLKGVALRALLTPAQRRREAGLRSIRRLGEGRVFESLAEWIPGDDTRTIDWKATARRGKVMARRYEDERRQQVVLVLDAGRRLTAESEGRARLEDAIEAVLHLAVTAIDHDDDVGLMVFTDRVERYLRPARGRRALAAIMDALAAVEGRLVEPDYPAAFAFLATRSRRRAFTVVFTDIIDRTASEALIAHTVSLRPRHLPLAVTLRDPSLERLANARPDDPDGAFRRAAAEELLLARAEALADMRHRGVLVLDVPPADAARAALAMYERLKRGGKI
ncbi:MAG TPA: DUF58 domain-containing protein [Gemmatimonadales bacterium]